MTVVPAFGVLRARRPDSPYVGLVPYGEDDAAFFFGRSHEAAIVAANLRSSRLTILYGPSGVGKSSLLMAGAVHALHEEAASGWTDPPFAVCTVRSWLDDPVRTLRDASRAVLQDLAGDAPLAAPRATLAETLRAWTEQAGTLLVVLDQFDEYFQYHGGEGDGARLTGFAAELAAIVNDPTLAVNVLLSIREDAWAKLDRFEGHIRLLFANYLRVDHLDLSAACEAIEGPIAAWNRTLAADEAPYEIEPQLVGAVLTTAAGGLSLTPGGDAGAADWETGNRVEAPFLQLVLERLWRAALADGEHTLTLGSLERLGGAKRIVENHLLEALRGLSQPEQDVASDCFRFLVSSGTTKIAHTAADLAEWTRRPETEVVAVLDRLCSGDSGRILRAVAPAAETDVVSYELYHDVLAEPVLAWRRVHERERSRRAAQRRLARVGGAALALAAIFGALSVWALIERGHANRLFHDQQAISLDLGARNARLVRARNEAKAAVRTREQELARQNHGVRLLRSTHRTLTRDVAQLRKTRDGLDRRIASVRAQNRRLAAGIARFNSQNRTLAARINGLDSSYSGLSTELMFAGDYYGSLLRYAGILKTETGAARSQEKTLRREWNALGAKAAPLGFSAPLPRRVAVEPLRLSAPGPAKRAVLFGIPGELAASDALRRQVSALQRRLTRLLEERARRADEATWLRSANELLRRQRDALRKENAQLATTRAGLESRERKLRQTLGEATAEHGRLSAQVAARERRNRNARHDLRVQQSSNATLQGSNDGYVDTIGEAQTNIGDLREANRKLVTFLAGVSTRLTRGAQDPAQDPVLAALLAVEAYRVTPYSPDDAAHPDVYNALWLVLNRVDANAARDLIAPTATSKGKVGTTTSALIRQKLCTFVARGFTPGEWTAWLPASAGYTSASSRPCG